MAPLPNELWSLITDFVGPTGSPVALPAHHEITRTLLSLTQVSISLRSLAIPLLYRHCLYVDSPPRLEQLLRTLQSHSDAWRTQNHEAWRKQTPKHLHPCIFDLRPAILKSLYIAPFVDDTIENIPVVELISSLFELLAPSLSRLVIDMPLRSLYPEDDYHDIRPKVREAFEKLTAVEEFTSARDELYLATREWDDLNRFREIPVWSTWPKLKRLALYNVDMESEGFFNGLRQLGNIETLVFTRPDGEQDAPASIIRLLSSLKQLLLVNVRGFHTITPIVGGTSALYQRREGVASREAEIVWIDVPLLSRHNDDPVEACQEWTRDSALSGVLWNAD
jgi:hypothetical protein